MSIVQKTTKYFEILPVRTENTYTIMWWKCYLFSNYNQTSNMDWREIDNLRVNI